MKKSKVKDKSQKYLKFIEEVHSIPFSLWVLGVIAGYGLGLLGWAVLTQSDLSMLFVNNMWQGSLTYYLSPIVLILLFQNLKIKNQSDILKFKNVYKKIIMITLGILLVPLLPFSIPQGNYFSFLNTIKEQFWGVQAAVWAWVVGWYAVGHYSFSGSTLAYRSSWFGALALADSLQSHNDQRNGREEKRPSDSPHQTVTILKNGRKDRAGIADSPQSNNDPHSGKEENSLNSPQQETISPTKVGKRNDLNSPCQTTTILRNGKKDKAEIAGFLQPRLLKCSWLMLSKVFNRNTALWWILGLFVVAFTARGWIKHAWFMTVAFDFGIYDQSVWLLSHEFSLANSVNGFGNTFGAHFQPILILLTPFYWLWNDARMLILLEVLVVAVGAFPVYRLSMRRFKSDWFALIMVVVYLLYLGNRAALAFPFHPSTFLAPMLLFAYDYFDQKKWVWHAVFIALAMLVKENAGLYVAGFGIFLLLVQRKYWKMGLAYILLGVGWVGIETKLILPALGSKDYAFFYYKILGDNMGQAILTMIRNPFYVIGAMFSNAIKVDGFILTLAGGGFLSIASPFGILALPSIGERLLSSRPAMWQANVYYSAPMAFAFMVGLIEGAKFYQDRLKKWIAPEKWLALVAIMCLLGTVAVFDREKLVGLGLEGSRNGRFKEYAQFWGAANMVPIDARLAAQSRLVPQLTHRKHIYRYPEGEPNYILLTIDSSGWPLASGEYKASIKKLLADGNWGLIYCKGGIVLFEKGVKDKAKTSERINKYLLIGETGVKNE